MEAEIPGLEGDFATATRRYDAAIRGAHVERPSHALHRQRNGAPHRLRGLPGCFGITKLETISDAYLAIGGARRRRAVARAKTGSARCAVVPAGPKAARTVAPRVRARLTGLRARSILAGMSETPTFDFFDPQNRIDPYPAYARLRAADPVHKSLFGWLITSHAEVARLNKDPRLGRDTRKLRTGGYGALFADKPGLGELVSSSMFHLDPPDHTRMRRLMAYAFTPRATDSMAERVAAVVQQTLASLPAQGPVELIEGFARPLPALVICTLLDVPSPDIPMIQRWSTAIAEHIEPTTTPDQIDAAEAAYGEFKTYLLDFVAQRRGMTGEGLIDLLIRAESETESLTPAELVANLVLLLIAGHETTTHLIGNGLLALLRHPDQLALLRRHPELDASAVEECLRYDSPVNTNGRVPSEDLEVAGKLIKKGQLILCMLGAANRDPEVFAEPDRLDITRNPNPHQSFGGGVHFCIGASLARLEARLAFRALLDRYADITLDESRVKWRDRMNLRGLDALWLGVRSA